jgi:hypothetical protein
VRKNQEAAELEKTCQDVHTECFGGDQVTAAIDQDVNGPGCHGARLPAQYTNGRVGRVQNEQQNCTGEHPAID